jgi:hypothetical protein
MVRLRVAWRGSFAFGLVFFFLPVERASRLAYVHRTG